MNPAQTGTTGVGPASLPEASKPDLSIDLSDESGASGWLPDARFVERWVRAALAAAADPVTQVASHIELSVHLVEEAASRALNADFRQSDHATNVLSFSAGLPPLPAEDGPLVVLGELVVCPAVIEREAIEQGKPLGDHWAHLIVHGTLHLVGYDHEQAAAAARMESLEIRLLSDAGIPDPYRGTADRPE